jgi:hypothetical protein
MADGQRLVGGHEEGADAPDEAAPLEVTIRIPTKAWECRLQAISERMGCPGDYEEAFGRALSLAAVVTWHLREDGATVELASPSEGSSTLVTGPLYGRGPGLTEADMAGLVG